MILGNVALLFATVVLAIFFGVEIFRTARGVAVNPSAAGPWRAGLSLGAIFFFLPSLFILSLTGEFAKPVFKNLPGIVDVSIEEHAAAVWFYVVLVCSVYFGVRFGKSTESVAGTTVGDAVLMRSFLWLAGIYASVMAWDVLSNGILSGSSHWYETRHASMSVEEGSLVNVLLQYVRNSARTLYFCGLFALWRTGALSFRIFLVTWIGSLAVDVFLSGNRFIVAATAFLFLFYQVVDKRWRSIALTCAASLPLAWFATVFMRGRGRLHSRDTGLTEFFRDVSNESTTSAIEYVSNAFEGINFNTFVSIFYDVPDRIPFLFGETFLKAFVFWVPRSLWEGKTLRVGQIIGEHYAGTSDLSIVATLPGEAWMNFGFLAVIVIPLLVIFAVRAFCLMFGSLPYSMWFGVVFVFSFSLCRASYAALLIDAVISSGLVAVTCVLSSGRAELWGKRLVFKN